MIFSLRFDLSGIIFAVIAQSKLKGITMQSRQELDSHIFKEFLKYDLASGSLWEIVEIFERHRANFREQVAQYEEDILKAKEELKNLREQILKNQKELSQKLSNTQTLDSNEAKIQKNEILENLPLAENQALVENQAPTENLLASNAMQQKILELELENKRLSIELRDLKQEIQLEKRENELKNAHLDSQNTSVNAPISPATKAKKSKKAL